MILPIFNIYAYLFGPIGSIVGIRGLTVPLSPVFWSLLSTITSIAGLDEFAKQPKFNKSNMNKIFILSIKIRVKKLAACHLSRMTSCVNFQKAF